MEFNSSSRVRKRKCTLSFDSDVILDSSSEKKPELNVTPVDLPVPSADYTLSPTKPAISLQELNSLSTVPPPSAVTALSSIPASFPSLLPVPHANATINAAASQHVAVLQPTVFPAIQSMPPPPPSMLSGMLPLSTIPPKPVFLEEAIDSSVPNPGGEGELQSMLPPPPPSLATVAVAAEALPFDKPSVLPGQGGGSDHGEQVSLVPPPSIPFAPQIPLPAGLPIPSIHRRHERKWANVSSREIILFIDGFLEEEFITRVSPDKHCLLPPLSLAGMPVTPLHQTKEPKGAFYLDEVRGLSRDRIQQIRRTLTFHESNVLLDTIVEQCNRISSYHRISSTEREEGVDMRMENEHENEHENENRSGNGNHNYNHIHIGNNNDTGDDDHNDINGTNDSRLKVNCSATDDVSRSMTGLNTGVDTDIEVREEAKGIHEGEGVNRLSLDQDYCVRVVSDYLVHSQICTDIPSALLVFNNNGICLDSVQQQQFNSFRKTHRNVETVLWILLQLYLNLSYISFCASMPTVSLSKEEFTIALIRGLYWLGSVSVGEALCEDVHYLVRIKREGCKQKERKQCSVCSTKGSENRKRSEFFCLKCNRTFCNSDECFSEYHKINGLPYYRYYTVDNRK